MIVLFNSFNSENLTPTSPKSTSTLVNYDFSRTDFILEPGFYYSVAIDLSEGERIEYHFETATIYQGLKFFICDQENIDLWTGGNTAWVYNRELDLHSLWGSFQASYADTWYVMLINEDYFDSVTFDLYVDDGTNTPYLYSAAHTEVGNQKILEPDGYLAVNFDSLKRKTSITVSFDTYFSTDGIDFFICSAEEFTNFRNDNTFQSFENIFDSDTGLVNSFKVPKKGDWVLVFHAKDQADTISLCYSIDLEDPTFMELYWWIFLIVGLVGIGAVTTIAIIYKKNKQKVGKPMASSTLTDVPRDLPPTQQPQEDTQILGDHQNYLFCVKCGQKNSVSDQFCKNCGREISESLKKL
jgi:hypothetical protein